MPESHHISSIETVKDFLIDMKLCLAEGRWSFVEREKNLQALSELNMVIADVPKVLQAISYEEYCDGPMDDDKGRSLEWWVFGPHYLGETLYVKVAIHPQKQLLCMSFHRNEFPLQYPYREATEA